MGLDLDYICEQCPCLQANPISRGQGATAYRLELPCLPQEREFSWAELYVPKGFPYSSKAIIRLSPDAILRIPHVDGKGELCIEGDPGPGLVYTAEQRIIFLLHAFIEKFLKPWVKGNLDGDFEAEALNYWAIKVLNARSKTDPVRGVWTVDSPPSKAKLSKGVLLIPNRIIVAADEQLSITNRVVQSMGGLARQRIVVQVADIPIKYPFTPATWPSSMADLDLILKSRLTPEEYSQFHAYRSRRDREIYRVALFRSDGFSFSYLLPDGPPAVLDLVRGKKTVPPLNKPLPLVTSRMDPDWTVGRDQHHEVSSRQTKHVLVIGAGALGSPIIDHLAKAGIGRISIIDDDTMASVNICRHLLGADSIGDKKVHAIAQRLNRGYPATEVIPFDMSAEKWFKNNSLVGIDAVLDLTGEPVVRVLVEQARQKQKCPLLIGWMEPYVAAAHACVLAAGQRWLQKTGDPLLELEAVDWPIGVIRQEPGCSSRFQSYTASSAAHAVALVAESALDMIDNSHHTSDSLVRSWVRGQKYLDKHWPGLNHKEWAKTANTHDGLMIIRQFP